MSVREGRAFTDRDRDGAPRVAIVNETAVRRYFNGQSPLGKRLGYDQPDTEIVGVIADARLEGLREAPRPMVYYPSAQRTEFPGFLDIRTDGDPAIVGGAVRRALLDVDPAIRVGGVTTISTAIERGIVRDRLVAYVASAFGALALLLACLGVYGVMSYAVARRRRELGVRSALGATPTDLRRLVIGDGMKLVVIGIVGGVAAAVAIARLMTALLFGIEGSDPLTHAGVATALVLAGLSACYLPARRAAQVDPATTLRAD
jgi:putative ABC transport system permease protein